MNRKALQRIASIPRLYPLVAFLTAKRVRVRGWSMAPTLIPGERVLFDRLAYEVGTPRLGDIVLTRHSLRPGMRLIKRVAAVPGDRVATIDGECVLAPDEFWLLGDADDESTDSRAFGPARRSEILARGWYVYWPPDRVREL